MTARCAWLVRVWVRVKGKRTGVWQASDWPAPYLSVLDTPPLPMCEVHTEPAFQYGFKVKQR